MAAFFCNAAKFIKRQCRWAAIHVCYDVGIDLDHDIGADSSGTRD